MARSPGGRSAGRVSIRVVPDSTLFRPDLLKSLQRLELTTRFNVRVLPDTAAFRTALRALEATAGGVRVNLDTTRAAAQFVAAWRALQTYAERNPVQVRLNVDQTSLTALAASRTVPVRLATSQALTDFRALWAQMTAYARANPIPVRLDVDRDSFEAQLRTLLQDRSMNIRTNVRGNALPLINRLAALPRNLFRGLADGLGSVAKFATLASLGFAGLSAGLAATTQFTGGLVLALGQIAGSLSLLPALGLAGAAALGSLALAFTGLKDASGPAGEVRDIVVGLKDEFQALRVAVQDNFFGVLVGPIRDLGDNWIPLLSDGLGDVAAQLGAATAGILDVLNAQQSLVDTETGLANTAALFAGIATAAPQLTQAFRDIAVVGSSFFPEFGTLIGTASTQFAAFIAQARADGSLEAFMAQSIEAVASFSRSLGNIGSAFGSIFTAANASGGGFLATLESVTGAFAALVASPEAQAGMSAFFSGAQAGLDAFLGSLGTVLPGVLAAVGPMLGTLTQTVGEVLGSIVAAIGPVIATLAPAFGQLASLLGPALVGFFAALAPSLQAVAGSLVPVLGAIGTALPPLLAALAPVVAELATSLAGVFAQLAVGVIPALADMFIALLPVIEELIPVLADLAVQFIEQLLPVLPQIVDALILAAPYWIQLIQLAAALAPVILAVTGVVFSVIGAFLEFINTNKFVQDTLRQSQLGMAVVIAVVKLFAGAVAATSERARTAFSLVGNVISTLRDRFSTIFAGIATVVAEKITSVVATVRGLPERISSAVGNLGSLLVQKGRDVIQGLVNGITSRIQSIRNVMATVTDSIAAFLPGSPVREGPLRVLNNGYAGGRIVDDILDPIRNSRSAVSGAMTALTAGPLSQLGIGGATPGAGVVINGNVGWDPDEVARRLNTRQRDALAVASMIGAL